MNFFTELTKRWKQDSPPFFEKMQKLGIWLIATGLALIGVPALMNSLIPDANFDLSLLVKIASYMVLSGAIIKIVAGSTVIDTTKLNKD